MNADAKATNMADTVLMMTASGAILFYSWG